MKIFSATRWQNAWRSLTQAQLMLISYKGFSVFYVNNNHDEFIAYCRKMIKKAIAEKAKK